MCVGGRKDAPRLGGAVEPKCFLVIPIPIKLNFMPKRSVVKYLLHESWKEEYKPRIYHRKNINAKYKIPARCHINTLHMFLSTKVSTPRSTFGFLSFLSSKLWQPQKSHLGAAGDKATWRALGVWTVWTCWTGLARTAGLGFLDFLRIFGRY